MPTLDPAEPLVITRATAQSVVDYLVKQPYAEVWALVQAMLVLRPVIVATEDIKSPIFGPEMSNGHDGTYIAEEPRIVADADVLDSRN